ncbi:MAG: MFS transporter [Elusimicrobiota bacterium]|jgi:GPH family glycoside/pentoside/hexuronide:cation symporter
MSGSTAVEITPQDRVPVSQKVIYGVGSLANNLLAAAIGCMTIVLNLGLKMDPAKIGLIMAFSKLTDACIDPVMGYISDHSSFKWGRRRPFIFVGALLAGTIFAMMWQLPSGHSQNFYFWFFLIGTNIFYMAYTIYAAPFIGLGYEMTADYHERTRIQAYANVIGQIAWMLIPWFWYIMSNKDYFPDSVTGARKLAIGVGGTVAILGILPAFFCKEPFYKIAVKEESKDTNTSCRLVEGLLHHATSFFTGVWVALKNVRFLKLVFATFLVFNGFQIVAGLSSYTIIYYLFAGDQNFGGKYMGWFGTFSSICTFCLIPVVAWAATRIGKKKAFIISTVLAILGYAIKWPCYVPGSSQAVVTVSIPLIFTHWDLTFAKGAVNWIFLSAPLISFGFAGLFTTVCSMIADVCDQDELENGHRREATFGAIYWWMVKLGMALALAISGYLLNFTGFNVEFGSQQTPSTLLLLRVFEIGVTIIAYILAIVVMSTYDLTQERACEIRRELEKRRGKTASVA